MSGSGDRLRDECEACFGGLAAIGQDPAGGWTRLAWTDEDRAARSWFESEASARGLAVEQDPAGNLWAWWPGPGEADTGEVVAVGSHLDTVRRGGAYDGALGVVSGLVAVRELIARGVEESLPPKPFPQFYVSDVYRFLYATHLAEREAALPAWIPLGVG